VFTLEKKTDTASQQVTTTKKAKQKRSDNFTEEAHRKAEQDLGMPPFLPLSGFVTLPFLPFSCRGNQEPVLRFYEELAGVRE